MARCSLWLCVALQCVGQRRKRGICAHTGIHSAETPPGACIAALDACTFGRHAARIESRQYCWQHRDCSAELDSVPAPTGQCLAQSLSLLSPITFTASTYRPDDQFRSSYSPGRLSHCVPLLCSVLPFVYLLPQLCLLTDHLI